MPAPAGNVDLDRRVSFVVHRGDFREMKGGEMNGGERLTEDLEVEQLSKLWMSGKEEVGIELMINLIWVGF